MMGSTAAHEITLIAPGGIRDAIGSMVPDFERRTGHTVRATFGSGGSTKQRVLSGEAFDVSVVQPPLAEVIASGHVVAATETPLATVAVGVAVQKGAARPDISTPEAVRKMLLAAKRISCPDGARGAAAGVSFDATLRKLGIFDEMQPRVVRAQGGSGAMTLLAKGEVEIGLTFLSEIHDPGVEIIGALPREISLPTELVGFVCTRARAPAAARAFLSYLASPDVAGVYESSGMRPGHSRR